jgi:hypothetical protein
MDVVFIFGGNHHFNQATKPFDHKKSTSTKAEVLF